MEPVCLWAAFVLTAASLTGPVLASGSSTGYSCPTLFNFYGDAYDCRKFYRCFWGEAYAFYCPDGTRWSQVLLTCDHEYNLPCHGDGPTYISNPTTKSSYVDYDSSDYSGGDHSSYDYQSYDNHGGKSYNYQSYNDGYSNGYQHSSPKTSPGYQDDGHQTQTLSYDHRPAIAYYDYSGRPSYIRYSYNSQPYYHPNHNFLAYNNFMAALGYKKK